MKNNSFEKKKYPHYINQFRRDAKSILSGVFILFLTVISFIFSGCVRDTEPEGSQLQVGDKLPEFSLIDNTGELISNLSFSDRKGVIVFFNTSCIDCRRELPLLEIEYRKQMAEDDSPLWICISREEDSESIQRFWEDNDLSMPWSAQTSRDIYSLFSRSGIPKTFIINKGIITSIL